jgi:2-polyprenyl-6-methoxyphenol hydroxylase-like FAD-dependent oxidoreductase
VATPDPIHHHLGGAMIEGLGLLPDRIHQAFFDGGMIFASPVARDTARVYMVCSSEEAMAIQAGPDRAASIVERFRASVPNGLLGDAWRSTGPVAFFPNASTVVDVPPTSRFVLIGDAMGRNDPSQGHGLSLVFHDVRTLAGMLATEPDWSVVPDAFHNRARAYRETLRQHAHWVERQATETGPEIDELKARIARARDVDPGAGGFAAIFAIGPDSLVADDAARRHFLGEDLEPAHTANQGRLAG